jgi:hypothetical protein
MRNIMQIMSAITRAVLALATLLGYGISKAAVAADTTPPSVPSGLTISAIDSYSCTLKWNASTDNDPRGVHVYCIYLDGKCVGQTNSASKGYRLTGLSASTSFSVKIGALDFSNNQSYTPEKTIKTATLGPTTTTDYTKPPVPEFRAPKLRPVYDFITKQGLRAMYVFDDQYDNMALINGLKNAGVNALVVYTPERFMTEAQFPVYCDGWKKVQDQTGMKVLITLDFGGDTRYTNTQFGAFISTTGVKTDTPCPLSKEYWQKVYGDRAKIVAQKGLTGCLIDMEMYRAGKDINGNIQTVYPTHCVCDYCWGLFCKNWLGAKYASTPLLSRQAKIDEGNNDTAWENFKEIELIKILEKIRTDADRINPDFMLGNLMYFEMQDHHVHGLTRGLGTGTQPTLILDELNYSGDIVDLDGTKGVYRIQKNLNRIYSEGYPAMYINGVSPEKLSPAAMKTQVDKMTGVKTSDLLRKDYNGINSDGYWVWCSYAYFTNTTPQWYKGMSVYTPDQYIQGLAEMNAAFNPHP